MPLSNSSLVHHTDSFRLILEAFGETHHLHLRPNRDLFHTSARIKYFKNGPDGSSVLDRMEPLLPHAVKAYLGEVIHPDASDTRLFEDSLGGVLHSQAEVLGWARMMVHSRGEGMEPVVEGAYTVNGVTHHIMPQDKYLRLKHPMDPHIVSESKSQLIIFRDSDLDYKLESFLVPPPVSSTCSHDRLSWNTDPWVNPSLRQYPASSAGFRVDFDHRQNKRDDVVGNPIDSKYVQCPNFFFFTYHIVCLSFESTIGQNNGCPIEQQIVSLMRPSPIRLTEPP